MASCTHTECLQALTLAGSQSVHHELAIENSSHARHVREGPARVRADDCEAYWSPKEAFANSRISCDIRLPQGASIQGPLDELQRSRGGLSKTADAEHRSSQLL